MLNPQIRHVLTELFERRFGLLQVSVIVALVLHLISGQAAAVPAAPNESLVHGEIIDVEAMDSTSLNIAPQRKLWRVKLRLIQVDAVEGKSSFLRAAEGQTIEAYTADGANPPAAVGKKVKGRVTFRGDERSGRYWIVGTLEVVPQ